MAITKYDQFVKDLKELESIELTIHDKKVDLKLRGTYKQIKTQYRSLSKKLHEDAWKKNGITSEEDKNKAEEEAIELVRRYLKDGKHSANLKVYKSVTVGWFGRHTVLYQR